MPTTQEERELTKLTTTRRRRLSSSSLSFSLYVSSPSPLTKVIIPTPQRSCNHLVSSSSSSRRANRFFRSYTLARPSLLLLFRLSFPLFSTDSHLLSSSNSDVRIQGVALGPSGGSLYIPWWGGVVLGPWFALKGRGLLVFMFHKLYA